MYKKVFSSQKEDSRKVRKETINFKCNYENPSNFCVWQKGLFHCKTAYPWKVTHFAQTSCVNGRIRYVHKFNCGNQTNVDSLPVMF